MSNDIFIRIKALLDGKVTEAEFNKELDKIEKRAKPVKVKIDIDQETQIKLYKSLQKIYKEEEKQQLNQQKYAQKALTDKEKQLQYEQKVRIAIEKNTEKEKLRTIEIQNQVKAEQSKYWSSRVKETVANMTQKPDELIKMADYYKELEIASQKYNETIIKQDAINAKNSIKSAQTSAEVFKAEFDKQDAYKKTSIELKKLQDNAITTNKVLKNFGTAEHHKSANELTASLQKLNITQNMTQKEMQETVVNAKLLSNQLNNVSREAKSTGNHSMTLGKMIGTAFEKFSV